MNSYLEIDGDTSNVTMKVLFWLLAANYKCWQRDFLKNSKNTKAKRTDQSCSGSRKDRKRESSQAVLKPQHVFYDCRLH